VLDASGSKLLLDERQPVFVGDAEDDGVRLGRCRAGLASGMHKLRADHAEGQIGANNRVVGEGVRRGVEASRLLLRRARLAEANAMNGS
jgi:hypothetical protein